MRDVEIPNWLKEMPLAPEFHPTDTEFADPIAYISKIEKEVGPFGICKVIPPLPRPSKKFIFNNLNKSLSKSPELCSSNQNSENKAVFTTRHQELGNYGKRLNGVDTNPMLIGHKQVWQSGETYTIEQFEAKAKSFAKSQLSMIKDVSPLVIESMFWKAASEKPIYIEYANDVPGTGFGHSSTSLDYESDKLSNSPWNLQIIARSPGSLTRFMPNDIPGVTSPMVYIGMLFSWFAWHVEDHELHSLNFLHVGSPKTWYAIPGNYAFEFEEIIREKAYGGNTDSLTALTILGEKTTLLSPEMMVKSGIPCCRLVQNPGEFVVTFPRAYHVGFSHGFNCGEAANFSTPQWLKVAKEAAIRRAVMNYLPMLSHQQLLYLLTMSFITRVPREVRSLRNKDIQKEEREKLVKKAFIEDILKENKLLFSLLEKSPSYRGVEWDLQSLPSSFKGVDITSISTEKSYEEEKEKENKNDYELFDFQVESGALPCIACGILGFPLMAILHPLKDLREASYTIEKLDSIALKRFLRPHIFCLEHAIQTEELLCTQGGANVLVICHSDFRKIKAHVSSISEQIGESLSYKDIEFKKADYEELNLIDLATENEYIEDWTVKLNINLQHSMKVRKDFPCSKIQHSLKLDGLEKNSKLNVFTPIWKSRKFRSKRCSKYLGQNKIEKSQTEEKFEGIIENSDRIETEEKFEGIIENSDHIGTEEKFEGIIENLDQIREDCESVRIEEKFEGKIDNSDQIQIEEKLKGIIVNSDHIEAEEKFEGIIENSDHIETEEKFEGIIENSDQIQEEDCEVTRKVNIVITYSRRKFKSKAYSGPIIDAYSGPTVDAYSGPAVAACSGPKEKESELMDHSEESESKMTILPSKKSVKSGRKKRKRESELLLAEAQISSNNYIRSPCESLRPRTRKDTLVSEPVRVEPAQKRARKQARTDNKKVSDSSSGFNSGPYKCKIENCPMSFDTKEDLVLHKRNLCTYKGCGKKFSAHKNVIIHQRVHINDRPLKCSWEGCEMTFKWAWARTEHLRVHTGERPYVCKVDDCGKTFRFVSDYSRHRRKFGHYLDD